MFKFKPYKDTELDAVKLDVLLPDGIYEFVVLAVTPKVAKSGNNMLELKLQIHSGGVLHTIQDWLVDTPKLAFKLKHFCDTIGLQVEYNHGEFAPNVALGKTGHLKLGRERGKQRDDGTWYPDRNVVKDYLKEVLGHGHKEPSSRDPLNGDIPF